MSKSGYDSEKVSQIDKAVDEHEAEYTGNFVHELLEIREDVRILKLQAELYDKLSRMIEIYDKHSPKPPENDPDDDGNPNLPALPYIW